MLRGAAAGCALVSVHVNRDGVGGNEALDSVLTQHGIIEIDPKTNISDTTFGKLPKYRQSWLWDTFRILRGWSILIIYLVSEHQIDS